MSYRKINEGFNKMFSEAKVVNESMDDLAKALFAVAKKLRDDGETNIKAYEVAFQDTIERLYPGKLWWEITDCEIFWSLFNGRDPELTVTDILKGVRDEYKDKEKNESVPTVSFGGTDEMVKEAGATEIKAWYKKEFPEDSCGDDLIDGFTFLDLFNMLDMHKFDYATCAGESYIRERVFDELAKIMDVDYDYIYQQWIDSDVYDSRASQYFLAYNEDETMQESKLTEAASNFNDMKGLPLLVFNRYEEVYDKAEEYAVSKFAEEHTEDEKPSIDELDPYFEDYFDNYEVRILDEEDIANLADDCDEFNKDCYYNMADDDESDCPTVEVKEGYYEGGQLYCNPRYLSEEMLAKVAKFFNDMKAKYNLTQLSVDYRFSNGETGYSIVKEDVEGDAIKMYRAFDEDSGSAYDTPNLEDAEAKASTIKNGFIAIVTLNDAGDVLDSKVIKEISESLKVCNSAVMESLNEPIAIYKEMGGFKATPLSNHDAQYQDASKVIDLKAFKSAKEIIDYFVNNMGKKEDDFVIIDEACAKDALKKLDEATDDDSIYFRAFVTNLGKYNEGDLVGEWVDFPIDEDDFNAMLERIGVSDKPDKNGEVYEEFFVTDYECNLPGFDHNDLGEYPSYEKLNEFGELCDQINSDGNAEAVKNAYEVVGDLQEAIDGLEDGSIIYYPGVTSDYDLGVEIIEQAYGDDIPEEMFNNYFDFAAFGRDVEIEYAPQDEGDPETAAEFWTGDEGASDYELGEAIVNELGMDGIGNKDYYFDYEAFGRDLTFENFTLTSDGAIEQT